jgi:hypothetical protein
MSHPRIVPLMSVWDNQFFGVYRSAVLTSVLCSVFSKLKNKYLDFQKII